MIGRRYRLDQWLVRVLVPPHVLGVYVLWNPVEPFYVGRSDTSLRRRLLEHAGDYRSTYFTYDVSNTADEAFDKECSLYHALSGSTVNRYHPHRPDAGHPGCTFCLAAFIAVRNERLSASVLAELPHTPTSPGTQIASPADRGGIR